MAAYDALRADVESQGLYARAYGFYTLYLLLVLCGTGLSLYIITASDSAFVQVANAIFFTFVITQAGMLGHDFSHGQVLRSERWNRLASMLLWGLFGGLSESAWFTQHDTHHTYVNQVGKDPDIDIPFLFSREQQMVDFPISLSRVVRYQHLLFFVSLPLWYVSKLITSWQKTLSNFHLRQAAELLLSIVHFGILFALLFIYLPWYLVLLFLSVHGLTVGLYLSFIFAPNHKGEEVIAADAQVTWREQISSTRNIRPSIASFILLGGLNFQVEHHLFTSMPRINYWKVHPLVKRFCVENAIPYHETSWLGSQREIYLALRRVARSS